MRCRDRPAWLNPCWQGIADHDLKMALHLEMLFYLISLGLIDSYEQAGEAPLDCDAFVGSTDVAAGALILRTIVV